MSSRARSFSLAVVLASSAALTACSGSSAGTAAGSTPTGSESAGTGGMPSGSSPPATTTTLGKPGPGGPSGAITAPVYTSPTPGASGGYYVFPNISRADDRRLGPKVLKQKGVRSIAYLSQVRQLEVYFTNNATDSDRQAVYDLVTGH
jgi:hypothetical protein